MNSIFLHQQPRNILFGSGARWRLADLLAGQRQVALVCGSRTLRDSGVIDEIVTALESPCDIIQLPSHEPTIDSVNRLTNQLKACPISSIVAVGGGSTIDSAKASAVLARQTQGANVLDFLEGLGDKTLSEKRGIPLYALPTTAGTGAEVTMNAVVASPEHHVKKSLRSPLLFPETVIVDPELQLSCPRQVTINSGMDAITQCFESYISCRATSFTRPLSREGFRLGMQNITRVVEVPNDLGARTAMSHCALNSGLALANGGLGVAHGIAAVLGDAAGLSHGAACAILLPFAAHLNLPHCKSDFETLATDIGLSSAEALVEHISTISSMLGVPTNFTELGVNRSSIADIVTRSYGNSMRGNPFCPEPEFLVEQIHEFYY